MKVKIIPIILLGFFVIDSMHSYSQAIIHAYSDIFVLNSPKYEVLDFKDYSEVFGIGEQQYEVYDARGYSSVFNLNMQGQYYSAYSGLFNYASDHYITGIVRNALTGLPLEGATVRSLSYGSLPTNNTGIYKIYLPPGFGYTVYASAPNYTNQYIDNIDVLPGNFATTINFNLENQDNYTNYRFRNLSQAPNPALLEIPKGGTGYAWFVVEGQTSQGNWLPVSNAIIGVVDGQGNPVLNKNGQAIQSNQLLYSFLNNPLHIESYGHFGVPVKTEFIQNGIVGQQEQFTLYSVNGQAVSVENQKTFIAKVVPYELAKSWGFRVYAKGGIGAGSITGIARANGFAGGGMGSVIKVKFDNPDNTMDWSAFQVSRKFDLFSGVSASFGPPDLLAIDAGISAGATRSYPYQSDYEFDMDNIAGLEAALAFYLFYEPTVLLASSTLRGGQIGVAFLSWLVQTLIANQGQNGLGIARISDAAGLDIEGHINAEVGVGFDIAKSLKLGMNASLGAHGHFGSYIQYENFTNTKNSKFYLGGGYDISTGIGPKFMGQNNTKTKFMYLSRLNQTILPSQLDVEFAVTNVKQNDNWKKIDLEAAIESNSELLNMYNLPGQRQKYTAQLSIDQQDVRNWLLNVAEIPNELANIGTTAVNVAIDNNSFKNDMERFLEKIYDEQNDDAPVLLDYSLKAEDKNEYTFDLTVQFPLPVLPAIDIVIGGGLEANNVTEYNLAEGFWVKGYPYLRTELPSPVNPNLSFADVMNELWQNVINKNIWEEIKNVIVAQITNSKFIKWLSNRNETQLVLLNEAGSTLEIRQNSIPPTIDSMFCRQWDWNQEPTRALSDADKVLQYKQYVKALRIIREAAVGMRYGIGGFYKFEPSEGSFTDSTKLTIAYSDIEIEGFDENSLAIYWEDSLGVWRHIPSIIAPDSNRVAAWIVNFGTYTLAPRMPYGNYGLQTQPDSIPSDGNTVAMIYSPVLLNNDSSIIADNSLFTVESSRGTILSEDIAPELTGIQVAVQNGIISFELISDSVATPIYLSARSVTGYAICEGMLKLYDTIAPSAPQNLSAVAGLNSAFISWEKVNDADVVGYKIYYDTDTLAPLSGIHTVAGEPSPIETGIGTNQNIIGLFNDSTYYFAVSAIDLSGNESQRSAFSSAIPFSCLPGIPADVSVFDITNNSLHIDWTSTGTETRWNIKFGAVGFDPDTEGYFIENIVAIPFSISSLEAATSYDFYVQAACDETFSAWSEVITVTTTGMEEIALNFGQGFTWFSLNVNPGNMSLGSLFDPLSPCYDDRVIGQTSFALYTGSSWLGSLTTLGMQQSYRMKLCSQQNLTLIGEAAPLDPFNLSVGYSWLGFQPQECMSISAAMAGLNPGPSYDDRVIGQSSFALYTGANWLGSLTQLCPGAGYVIKLANAQTLTYPAANAKDSPVVNETLVSPTGIYPAAYQQHSMMVVAKLRLPDGAFSLNEKDVIYASINGEIRGMAQPMADNDGLIFLSIGSNEEVAQPISFMLWLDERQELLPLNETLSFEPLAAIGELNDPFIFTLGEMVGLDETTEGIWIGEPYPNPFKEQTTVPYFLNEAAELRFSIYDSRGVQVRPSQSIAADKGHHQFSIESVGLTRGVYVLEVSTQSTNGLRIKRIKLIVQ